MKRPLDPEGAVAAVAEIERAGGAAMALQADVSREDRVFVGGRGPLHPGVRGDG